MKETYRTLIAGAFASILMTACHKNNTYEIVHQEAEVTIVEGNIKDGRQDFILKESNLNFENFSKFDAVLSGDGAASFVGPDVKNNHPKCYSSIPMTDYPNDLWTKNVAWNELEIVYIKFGKGGKLFSQVVDKASPAGDEFEAIETEAKTGLMKYTKLVDSLSKLDPKELGFKNKVTGIIDHEDNTPFDRNFETSKRKIIIYLLLNKKNVKFQNSKNALVQHNPSVTVHSPYTAYIPRDSKGNRLKNIVVVDFYRGGDIKKRVIELANEQSVEPSEIDCSYPYDLGVVLKGQKKTKTKVFIDPSNGSKGPP